MKWEKDFRGRPFRSLHSANRKEGDGGGELKVDYGKWIRASAFKKGKGAQLRPRGPFCDNKNGEQKGVKEKNRNASDRARGGGRS